MTAGLFVLLLMAWSPRSFAGLDSAECFPKNARKDMPIGAIYLHGLYPPENSKRPWHSDEKYAQWEKDNRAYLEKFAIKHNVRIAVPVAREFSNGPDYGLKHNWLNQDLKSIEADARKACGGATLGKPRALIGFSNGGNRALGIGTGSCEEIKDYSSIMVIGPTQKKRTGQCAPETNLIYTKTHKIPPAEGFFEENMSAVLKSSQKPVAPPPAPRPIAPGPSQPAAPGGWQLEHRWWDGKSGTR